MRKREVNRLGKKIVQKVNKYWSKHDFKEKEHLETGMGMIVNQIAKHTKISFDEVAQHTDAVFVEFNKKYDQIPQDMHSSQAVILMLYTLYMKHLGKI